MAERLRIGALAERAGVTLRTIRHYEALGLMPPGERVGRGQHYYSDQAVLRLRKIDQLKALGLSLDEVGQVIDLYFTDPSGVTAKRQVLAILRRHLATADARIAALGQFRSDLAGHIARFEAWLATHTDSEGQEHG
ncbi:MerR family transcriptional regulator [Caulobacter sp. KR2-114]|uniref:MerR family transcriptional regulator n=1 Tax=Caulobacter sp. KR2-114 TaxID=3400912 RepID=UPI003BFCF1BA